jgi:hypothetical protein
MSAAPGDVRFSIRENASQRAGCERPWKRILCVRYNRTFSHSLGGKRPFGDPMTPSGSAQATGLRLLRDLRVYNMQNTRSELEVLPKRSSFLLLPALLAALPQSVDLRPGPLPPGSTCGCRSCEYQYRLVDKV